MKTLIFGSDHAGYRLKELLKRDQQKRGVDVKDLTPELVPGDDYPTAAKQAAKLIAKDKNSLAVLVCGTGLGMDIAANRTKGVRAVVIRDLQEAKLSREHNHANVIVFGSWMTPAAKAKKILDAWLATKPSNASRHVRRVNALDRP